MQKEYQLAVDIEKKILTPSFEVNTLDLRTIKLKITITKGMTLVDLTDIEVRMSIRKPDGNVLFQDCQVVNAKGGQVEIILENQAYIMPGSYSAEIMCFKGSDKVAVTGSFSYRSIRGIMDDKAVESKSEFTAITGMIGNVESLVNDLKENGTGIDAQARQEVQQVSEQLADIVQSVKTFGAVGDGATDDTQKIKNAVSYLASIANVDKKPTLHFPNSVGYRTTDSIVIPSNINVTMESPVIYDGEDGKAALIIGETGIDNRGLTLKLHVRRSSLADWTNEDNIGIKLVNCNSSNIDIFGAINFTIGVQCMASGNKGFAYNDINPFYLLNNKYGMDLTNETSGWCNENMINNTKIACTRDVGRDKEIYGIRITSKDGLYKNNNNNVFIKPAVETNSDYCIPILMEHGLRNTFTAIRTERNSLILVKELNSSTENKYDIAYGGLGERIECLSDKPNYVFSNLRVENINKTTQIFDSKFMPRTACYYDGSTLVNIPNVHLSTSANGSINKRTSNITINSDFLEVATNRAIGVMVNTSVTKRFVVKRDTENGYGGRVFVRCYDSNDSILTDNGIVKGASDKPFSPSASFGGGFITGSDSNEDVLFQVSSDVKKIALLLRGTTSPLRIRSFSVLSLDGWASAWAGYEEIHPGINLGIAPPTTGTWEVGRTIMNDVPSVGQPRGWMCTATGTPGTWVSIGSL